VAGRREDLHVGGLEAHLFAQLPEQGLLRRLVAQDAPLRELPAAAVAPTPEEYFAGVADQHDPDVGAKPLGIDEVGHGIRKLRNRLIFSHCGDAVQGTLPPGSLWPGEAAP
jgi:hypothetical protein